MKRTLFLMLTLIASTIFAAAQVVTVTLVDGSRSYGEFISCDENLLVIEPYTAVKYAKKFKPVEVTLVDVQDVGQYKSIDGKFVFDESSRVIKVQPQETIVVREEAPKRATPNEVIGKAFKATGNACISLGIPSLIAGTILVAYGNTDLATMPTTKEKADKNASKAKCAAAGYVLMPMGAALTIVGIPLCVHGKKIAQMNFNYTGNGAGLAVNW